MKTVFMRVLLLTLPILALSFASSAQKTTSPCPCNYIKIFSSPRGEVKEGEIVEFIALPAAYLPYVQELVWTISEGEIISGQGTPSIRVRAPSTSPVVSGPSLRPAEVQTAPAPPGFIPSSQPLSGIFSLKPSILKATLTMVGKSRCSCGFVSTTVSLRRAQVFNAFANVAGLTLGTDILTLRCADGRTPKAGVTPSESMLVDVTTTAFDAEDDVLSYHYTVSGGRIVGRGNNVRWDLTGVAPGSYSITVGVDDGRGLCGKTWTEEITVVGCEPTCGLITCPTISITGPDELTGVGEFTANAAGGAAEQITFEWTVANGVILSGQGTPSVKAKLEPTSSITVKIGGFEDSCISSATKDFVNGVMKP